VRPITKRTKVGQLELNSLLCLPRMASIWDTILESIGIDGIRGREFAPSGDKAWMKRRLSVRGTPSPRQC